MTQEPTQGVVRVGFLGAGFIAAYHAGMLAAAGDRAAIVAVHDLDHDRATRFAERHGAEVAASADEVLAAVDAVYVTTWTAAHRSLVEAAAAAGVAVFCEKPLATTAADAAAMVAAVEAAGVVNQVGLVLRDSPSFLLVRHLVQRSEAGRLMTIVFRDDQFIPIQGLYASTWRADAAKAGAGTLLEHSVHDLDLLEWIGGPVAEVSARTRSFHGIEGIEDLAVATLSYEGGAVGSLTSVWHDVLARPSMRHVEVLCERAHVVLEGDALGPVRWTYQLDDGASVPGLPGPSGAVEGDGLRALLADLALAPRNPDVAFIEAVASGAAAHPSMATALRAQRLADACYRSARPVDATPEGVPVAVE
jgi:predicted dehydrogenase